MLCTAVFEAIDDAGLEPRDLEGGVVAFHGEAALETGNIGPLVSDAIGMSPASVTGISTACSGGGYALYHAHALVASGLCKMALAAGFEKGSDLYEYIETIGPSSDAEYDYAFGLTHLDWLALMSKQYMLKYGVNDPAAVEQWVEDRHRFARLHKKSFYYGQPMLAREDIQKSLLHLVSTRADGAVAAVVTTPEVAKRLRKRPIFIDGIACASSSAYLPHKFNGCPDLDIADSDTTRAACARAFGQAGIKSAMEADLVQVSDGAPGIAFMELEAIGLYEAGQSWKGVIAGRHGPEGRYPANTHGGSIAFGHASGAAALVNVVESVTQMRDEAEERQVKRAVNVAVCQASGGANCNNTVAVLRRS
jgi:acetyl-CoA C-acetyltransferase